jgi:putative heme-binding domain-containing protein
MRTGLIFAALLIAAPLYAQHEATSGDIDDGRRLYMANCARCHGPEGGDVPGVELNRQIRRATTDNEIRTIIQKGIPNTAMPPHTLKDFPAGTIVAYLRFMQKSAADSSIEGGDPARGKAIFEGKGNCLNCHRVKDAGSRFGPDLTDIGAQRRGVELRRSLLEPDAEVLPQNRAYHIVTKDGKTINGRLLNQDAFTVQILDSTQHLQSLQKSSLTSYAFAEHSPMPSQQGKLSPAELTDLLAYLVSLKGIENQ